MMYPVNLHKNGQLFWIKWIRRSTVANFNLHTECIQYDLFCLGVVEWRRPPAALISWSTRWFSTTFWIMPGGSESDSWSFSACSLGQELCRTTRTFT